MIILGLSCFYHDSAACLMKDGQIVAAVQEERLSRIKHDASFPKLAISECLKIAKLTNTEIDIVVFYEKPLLKFERILETYVENAPKGFSQFKASLPEWVKNKIFQKKILIKELNEAIGSSNWNDKLKFSNHHLSHAASAFFPSPFEEAAVVTMDGVGEWATTSIGRGRGNQLEILKEIEFPSSIGLLYSAFTSYCGFKVNSGEYKLMGLAPYGNPIYASVIREHLLDIGSEGCFSLNMRYFGYTRGLSMVTNDFCELFGRNCRREGDELDQFYMDIAASVQTVTEELVLGVVRYAKTISDCSNLVLAGGVALNCVANAKIRRSKIFENIWIQPAAGDAGGALGACYVYHYLCDRASRSDFSDQMQGTYLGPIFDNNSIKDELESLGAVIEECPSDQIIALVARFIADGKAVGWMSGRMEFGPRALGARSILADPRSPSTQKTLNLKIKYRESFRPFAPSVLEEDADEWFCLDGEMSPYMLMCGDVTDSKRVPLVANYADLAGMEKLSAMRSVIPAVVHVDFSARIQTVSKKTNPRFHALISAFKELTGVPVLVNTSFNVRGEPIVCTPTDAFRCFMGTELDVLVVGDYICYKTAQSDHLKLNYKNFFQPD